MWLTRGARGHGVGRAAAAAVLREAVSLEASAVQADTTTANTPALAVLARLGFQLKPDGDGRHVRALLLLQPQSRIVKHR
ncbi:MAG TPA: GNAT family N-acetyltransferase [Pseudonocardiaceae bacterium]|nr:GNAT family N-acetyltransferase [Pseudonocardiaceae bacterium]